jgi:sarcosine oxidase subunit gamma
VTGDVARSPLAHRVADLERAALDAGGAVGLSEEPFLSQVDVRVDPARAARLGLPQVPNTRAARGNHAGALWLGPDEWLVVGPPGTAASIVEELEADLAGSDHSVVDVSAGRAVLRLRGAGRFELLSMGCSLDLHPRAWTSPRCAQTLVAGIAVILEELVDSTRVYVRPSFGDYLVDWLIDAVVGLARTGPGDNGLA